MYAYTGKFEGRTTVNDYMEVLLINIYKLDDKFYLFNCSIEKLFFYSSKVMACNLICGRL